MEVSSEHLHRCIIFLNNVGVGLMEKNCHRQSTDVMRDALAAMKVLQGSGSLVGYDTSPLLAKAARNIANPEPQTGLGRGSYVSVKVLSDRVTDRNLGLAREICHELQTPTETECSAQSIMAIRIELNDFESVSSRDPCLTSAILMHNYGLSLYCLSIVHGLDQKGSKKLRTAAMQFATLSSTLLAKSYYSQKQEKEGDYFHRTTILFLEVIILAPLYKGLLLMGMVEHATSCLYKLWRLSMDLQDIDCSDLLSCIERTAPAA